LLTIDSAAASTHPTSDSFIKLSRERRKNTAASTYVGVVGIGGVVVGDTIALLDS